MFKHYKVGTRSGAVIKILDNWERERLAADKDRDTLEALIRTIGDIERAQQDGEIADKATERGYRDLFALSKSLRKLPRQLRLDIPAGS